MSNDERLREYAKRLLRQLMEDISEDHYCAGWMMNLELSLWRMVKGGPRGYGMGDVSEEQVEQLRQLSKDAGGWFAGYQEFVTLDEWLPMYRERESAIKAKKGTP